MIAIDFGTTNSSIAVFADGDTQPRVQPIEYADADSVNPSVMPSAVSSCKDHECKAQPNKAGNEAIRHYFGTSHDVSFLQEMKLHFDSTTKHEPTFVTKDHVVLREEGSFLSPIRKPIKHALYEGDVPLEPKDFVPGTTLLIKDLIKRVNVLRNVSREGVFGVPASFKDAGKRRLRNAAKVALSGETAGFENVHVYLEPLAAARAYTYLDAGNLLVLDYGGGTLDISVLTMEKGAKFDLNRVTYDGFSEGGSRMDQKLLDYCLDKSGNELTGWYAKQNILVQRRIKRNVESAKIRLSTAIETAVDFPGSKIDPVSLTRANLSHALQPITTRMTVKITEVVLKAVGKIENIDFVVLSGGSSLTTAVQDGVLSIFRHIPKERFLLPDASKPEDVERCLCAVATGLAWLRKDGFPPIDFGD